MHKFFILKEALLLGHRMIIVMQTVLLKKQNRQCGVTLCREFLIAKLTMKIPITPPESFWWRKMHLRM
jgi:hypothetical protein